MGTQAALVTGPVIIQTDSDREEYNLLAPNGDEGEISDWGDPATLVSGSLTYMVYRDADGKPDPDIGSAVYLLNPEVYSMTPVVSEEVEVEFDDEEGEDEEEEEEEGEEEGEEEENPAA